MNDSDNAMRTYERHRQARAKLSAGKKGAVFDALAAANITRVLVEFDGEGDSGQIHGMTFFRGEERITFPSTAVAIQEASWRNAEALVAESTIEDAIETLCYDYLEDTHGGWENNDGAFGEFRLDVAERTVELEFNGRFTDTYTSTHTF